MQHTMPTHTTARSTEGSHEQMSISESPDAYALDLSGQ